MTKAELVYQENMAAIEDRDEVILRELPQVYYIARRVWERIPQHVPFEDMVHAGVIGLIEAVRSYDARKGVPFKAFAKFRIRGAILDSLREMDWGSRPLRRKGRMIEEAIAKLSASLGRQPQDEEIAAEIGTTLEELYAITTRLDGLNLVGQEVTSTSDRSETTDLIESAPSQEEGPYDLCLRAEVRDQLADAISTLSEKEQTVISLYYKEELTMREIAVVLQLRESRVSQIHSLALPKLRAALKKSTDPSLLAAEK